MRFGQHICLDYTTMIVGNLISVPPPRDMSFCSSDLEVSEKQCLEYLQDFEGNTRPNTCTRVSGVLLP